MRLCDGLDDRKSQSGAPVIPLGREESVEDLRPISNTDTRAAVVHLKFDRRASTPYKQVNPLTGPMTDGVVQQVYKRRIKALSRHADPRRRILEIGDHLPIVSVDQQLNERGEFDVAAGGWLMLDTG